MNRPAWLDVIRVLSAAVPAAAMGACMGEVQDEGGGAPAAATGTTGPMTAGAGGQPVRGNGVAPSAPAVTTGVDASGHSCTRGGPAAPSLRRLTRTEYQNTVRDLLGNVAGAGTDLLAEEKPDGYPFRNRADLLPVPPVLAQQYLASAEQLAAGAVGGLVKALPCSPATDGDEACATRLIDTFGKRAFRRPVDAAQRVRLLGVFRAGRAGADFATGARLVVETILQQPEFLYRVEIGVPQAGGVARLDDWEVAARLSYLLYASMPDDALFAAAEAGKLHTPADVAVQAARMLADPRARRTVADFHDQWLDIDEIGALAKDPKLFPGWTAATPALLQDEARRFVDAAAWGDAPLTKTLFAAPYTFLNDKLGAYYGIKGQGTAFAQAATAPGPRAASGVLTLGGLLAVHAAVSETNPVKRGKFVRQDLLCQTPPPPPPNANIVPPKPDPKLTTRERFAQHSADPSCGGCHKLMDPIGLGFENYDASGRWRDVENGKSIDATGEVIAADVAGPFDGAPGLGAKLAGSADAAACVARQWFRYASGRLETDADDCLLRDLAARVQGGGYRALLTALVQNDGFLTIASEGGAR